MNIILLSKFPLDLWTCLRLLFLPCLLVISMNIALFFLLYRRQLRGHFDIKRLPELGATRKSKSYLRYPCRVRVLVAVAYKTGSAAQFPLSLVALVGALALFIGALIWKQTTLPDVGKQISWSIFGFIGGMFIVVQAVESTGLTTQFGQLLLHLSGGNSFGAVMVGTFGSALGTNLINNVPMAVVVTSALQTTQHPPIMVQHAFSAASIFGCDLGPYLTTGGVPANVPLLTILRQRHLDVSGLDYLKVGIIVTPFMLFIGALAIWLLLL